MFKMNFSIDSDLDDNVKNFIDNKTLPFNVDGEVDEEEEAMVAAINWIAYNVVAYIIVSVGIIGNLLNIVVLTRPNLKGVMYVYLLGLAISNLFVLVTAVPALVDIGGGFYSANYVTAFFQAHLEIPMLNTFMASSVYIIICMTVNRYISIYKPTQFQRIHTFKNARIAITFSFLGGVILHIPLCFEKQVVKMCENRTMWTPSLDTEGGLFSSQQQQEQQEQKQFYENKNQNDGSTSLQQGYEINEINCTWQAKENDTITAHLLYSVYIWGSEILLRFGPIFTLTILNIMIITRFQRIARKRQFLKNGAKGESTGTGTNAPPSPYSTNGHCMTASTALTQQSVHLTVTDSNGKSFAVDEKGKLMTPKINGNGVNGHIKSGNGHVAAVVAVNGNGSIPHISTTVPHGNGNGNTPHITKTNGNGNTPHITKTNGNGNVPHISTTVTNGNGNISHITMAAPNGNGNLPPNGNNGNLSRASSPPNGGVGSNSRCSSPNGGLSISRSPSPIGLLNTNSSRSPSPNGKLVVNIIEEDAHSNHHHHVNTTHISSRSQTPIVRGQEIIVNVVDEDGTINQSNDFAQNGHVNPNALAPLLPGNGYSRSASPCPSGMISRAASPSPSSRFAIRTPSRSSSRRKGLHSPEERMLVVVLIAIVILFICCTTPAAFLSIFFSEKRSQTISFTIFRATANNLELLNFALNFYIYCLCSAEIRRAFVSLFHTCLHDWFKGKATSFASRNNHMEMTPVRNGVVPKHQPNGNIFKTRTEEKDN